MAATETSVMVSPPASQHGLTMATENDPTKPLNLLSMEKEQAAREAMQMFEAQRDFMQPLLEQAKINEWTREGITGTKMVRDPNRGWVARLPYVVRRNQDTANKAASLARKMNGILTADPPAADAVPGEGEGDDPSAAEFTTRALEQINDEIGRIKKLTRAIDYCHTGGTAFEHFFYDPYGAGRVPVQIQAGYEDADPERGVPIASEAQTLEDADSRPVLDELGLPTPERQPWPSYKTRFLAKDKKSLTDRKGDADTRWEGKVQEEIVRVNNVRLYPHTAEDIDDAYGAAIFTFVPWGRLKKQFPDLAKLPEDKKGRIFNWLPDWADQVFSIAADRDAFTKVRSGDNQDEWPVPVLATYFDGNKCPSEYPEGAYILQLADCYVLHRGEWCLTDPDGVKQPRIIPLAQMTLFTEGRGLWPGVGLIELLAPGNEARATLMEGILDIIDRFASIKTLMPISSVIDPLEYRDRNKRYVRYNPAGGTPMIENLPPFPSEALNIYQMVAGEQDDISSLQQSGQGLEASNVKSGVQAMTVIAQVQAALSPQARAVVDCYLRGCRIILETVRAHYSRPRQLAWSGEDGRHKQRAWERSDLGTTKDVALRPSTMTMLRPVQKALLARELSQMGILPPEDFAIASEKNLGGLLAMRDNPYRQRIRRQLEDWKEGPPEGWVPPAQIMQPSQVPVDDGLGGQMVGPDGVPMMQPEVDPATGEPVQVPAINPETGDPLYEPDPAAEAIWDRVPADVLPNVAIIRLTEMARLSSSTAFTDKPKEWRLGLENEFRIMLSIMQAASMTPNAPQTQDAPQMNAEQRAQAQPGGIAPEVKPKKAGADGAVQTQAPTPMNTAT